MEYCNLGNCKDLLAEGLGRQNLSHYSASSSPYDRNEPVLKGCKHRLQSGMLNIFAWEFSELTPRHCLWHILAKHNITSCDHLSQATPTWFTSALLRAKVVS